MPSRNNPSPAATEVEAAARAGQEGRTSLPGCISAPHLCFPTHRQERSMLKRFPQERRGSIPPRYSCIQCSSIHRVLPPRLAWPPQGSRLPEGSASLRRSVLPRAASVAAPGTDLGGISHKTLLPPARCVRAVGEAANITAHRPAALRDAAGRGCKRPLPYPRTRARLPSSLAAYFFISHSAACRQPGRRSRRGTLFFVWEKKNCHKFIYLKDFSPENSPSRLPFSESESLA